MATERKKSKVEHPPTLLGATAFKPVERHGLEAIRYALYNPDTGAILSRTPKSWFLITVFYCIYYSCLAAFWYGMLTLFLSTLPEGTPRYMTGESLIGRNPGVGIRPQQCDEHVDSSMYLLQYNAAGEIPNSKPREGELAVDFAKRLELFLEQYEKQDNNTNLVDCDNGIPDEAYEDSSEKDDEKSSDDVEKEAKLVKRKACRFNLADAQQDGCKAFPYGFNAADSSSQVQPCFFLKVNKVFNWKPKPYTADDLTNKLINETGMPERIQELIKGPDSANRIYVHCEGENPADRDDLEGLITYSPADQFFDLKYFPFTQEKENYISPLVGIKMNVPPEMNGRLFHIQCKLWHKEAVHNTRDKMGLVRFEFMLEMSEKQRNKQKEEQEKDGYNA